MKITWSKFEHGWIRLRIDSDSIQYDLLGSHVLNDCLFDLLNATIRLNKGDSEAFVEFWEEPASRIWHLVLKQDKLAIHHYYLDNSVPSPFNIKKHIQKAKFQNTIRTDLQIFTNQVANIFSSIRDSLGDENYRAAWREFPAEKFELLKKIRNSSKDQHPSLFEKKTTPLQKLTIHDIVLGSSETEIREFSLKNNILTILAHLPYFGELETRTDDDVDEITVRLKITVQVFQVNIPSTIPFPAHFRLHNLQHLNTNMWGYYVPSADKSDFFLHQKLGYSLAYGYHHKKFPWLFSVISGSHVADILIANLNCIELWLENSQ